MDNHNKKFSIKSYTCTLFQGNDNEYQSIFGDNKKYLVPIFQRPYSWTEKELEPFINDIFKGFWGIERDIKNQEPMFIGTMQLSDKNEIIDGQQRITTLIVLLRILQIQYIESQLLSRKIDCLETKVNSGKQDEYLKEFLSINNIEEKEEDRLNPYLKNARLIKSYFEENIRKEDDNEADFSIDCFCEYLFTQVYFVVIETCAGLSKTLQIFNAINTTGLDLNGGDLFKIRMYEYLTDKKKQDPNGAFENISNIYAYLDDKNKEAKNANKPGSNILYILDIYKDFLISKYDLPNVLYQFGVETFYDRLFDTLLGIKVWEYFTKLNSLELSLDEIKKFIDIKFEWEFSEYLSMEGMFAYRLIGWSRYSRYLKLVYLFLYKYANDDLKFENIYQFLILLNKLFFIYSIWFGKAVNRMHSFMQNITKKIITDNFEILTQSIIASFVAEKLESCTVEQVKEWTKNHLEGAIAYNAKTKNLVCRMSEYLSIIQENKDIDNVKKLLFEPNPWVDIEHIHANADDSIQVEEQLQNGIGNLAILEGPKNRSISNKKFAEKREVYRESQYSSIKKIAEREVWTEKEILQRRDEEINTIINYLFPSL